MSPLHYAAKGNHVHLVEWLLKTGANINATDKARACRPGLRLVLLTRYLLRACQNGVTSLIWAATNGNVHCVRALLAKGACIQLCDMVRLPPLRRASSRTRPPAQQNNRSALWQAAASGHADCVEVLLDKNCAVDVQDVRSQPLSLRRQNTVEGGLTRAHRRAGLLQVDGKTPLFAASKLGHVTCVQALLRHGARSSLANAVRIRPCLLGAGALGCSRACK